jgi:pimeloyl-ACP methyl ester carboxylesterase
VSTGRLTLPDGRRIGYAEYGDRGGPLLVYLHGFPGSRLAGQVFDGPARARGVRVAAPERPGMGLSSPQPRRTLLDHARDVCRLAEALGFERFALVAESGGGPYALACAHELAGRLEGVAVVGGLGPVGGAGATVGVAFKERIGYVLAARAPVLARPVLVPVARWARRWPRQFLRLASWQLEDADRRALAGPFGDLVAADFVEAFRQGGAGVAHELALLFGPWPFEPGAIRVPVAFFHGEEDRTVSVAVSRALAASVPGARLHVYAFDGHYSLLEREAGTVIAAAGL